MKQTKILVVEDEFIIGQDLQSSLIQMGYDVPLVLSSAEDIVTKVRENAPDLVLMDIHLGGSCDGIEAAEMLKKQMDMHVLYLTSYTDQPTIERAKLTEPLGYLSKPFQQRDLKTSIEMAVYKTQMDHERREAQAKQKELEAQVQHVQKLESIGVLAGGIAHDFNNLLCIILGNTSLALSDVIPPEDVKAKVKLIELTAVRASELVKQLLSYSGKNRSILALTNLSAIIGEMGSLVNTSISKKIRIDYRFGENLPQVLADMAQMRQVVMNLILNASDAIGDEKGVITVSTGSVDVESDDLTKILMGTSMVPGKYIFLEVTDTGAGMDAETRVRIFDPFFTTKFTGRGLGLAVVLGIVKAHGGGISVVSDLGKGTIFRVFFPVDSSHLKISDAQGKTKSQRHSMKASGTVLVVDDEGSIVTFVKEILEHEGFRVLTANGGNEAIQVFQQHSTEVVAVLLDMTMPDLNGEETLARLRRVRPDIRIVLTSGYHQEEAVSRLSESMTKFIQKPYMANELVEAMYAALEGPPSV